MIKNVLIGTASMFNRATTECYGFNEAMEISERIAISRDDDMFHSFTIGAILIGINQASVSLTFFGKTAKDNQTSAAFVHPMHLAPSTHEHRIKAVGPFYEAIYPIQLSIAGINEGHGLAEIQVAMRVDHPKLAGFGVVIQLPSFKHHVRGLAG